MFDNQIQNQGQVPGNLPTSDKEPEDIFAGTESASAIAPSPENITEDVLSQPAKPASPTALSAGILKPKTQNEVEIPMPKMETAPVNISALPAEAPVGSNIQTQDQPQMDYQVKSPSIGKGIFTIVIVIVVVAILGGGGWFVYSNFIAGSGEEDVFVTPESESIITTEPENLAPIATEEPEQNLVNEIADEEILFGELIDRDGDGLNDERELTLGTDPDNWDTDGDELGDGDEVLSWETDPLNPDTDGDNYLDGLEIKSGYSPIGSGKLFEAPANEEEMGTVETNNAVTNTIE